MSEEGAKPGTAREDTDESLRLERENVDRALAEKLALVQATADEVVHAARERADGVLRDARSKADQELDAASAGPRVRDRVETERDREDSTVERERATADKLLHDQRDDQSQELELSTPLQRKETDRHLHNERGRSDGAVANRDDFMGMISHDLRDLLSVVSLKGRVLSKQASDSEEGRRTIAAMTDVQRYIVRMQRLIGDLVDMTSIDAGQLAVRRELGDVSVLIKEAGDAFREAATEKGVRLEYDFVKSLPGVEFDHGRILQVLANIVSNAIKFTERGGVISLTAESDADEVVLHVRDTGPGIAPDMLEVMFERFRQVGATDRRGLGLGLYISKCIVDSHGGRIWAESTLGTGSVVSFALPLAPVRP